MKTILIAGASGFVGGYLSRQLLSEGHRVIGLGTSPHHALEGQSGEFSWIRADTTRAGAWQDQAARADVIVNLAGRSIVRPWTASYKKKIYDTRILTTKNIVAALPDSWSGHLLNASAVGCYGDRGETVLTEETAYGSDFLASVCRDWETEAQKAEDKGARVSLMRFGVVLGQGGALTVMDKAFKLFAGGPLGSGRQWFPWIHIKDLGRAVSFLVENGLSGAFNFTGPEPVRQKDFASALGRVLHRPAWMPAPAPLVRWVMGELGASLLQSQRALPQALTTSGFAFTFSRVEAALSQVYVPADARF